jgi:two-component system, OmpR family, response regulator ResD
MSRPVGQSLVTRVLVVARREPQEPIGGSLKRAGYSVAWADCGEAVARSLERSPPHIVVVHGPALGHHETERIVDLAARSRIPVLVLSRPDTDPTFGSPARQIEALLRERRDPPEDVESLVAGTLVIDLRCHTAHVDGTAVDLTSKEFELLCVFARQPGRAWSRQHLIDLVWGYDYAEPRVVTTHIGNLRKKLRAAAAEGAAESIAEAPCIETVWNVGYRLAVPGAGRSASAHPARPAVRSAVCDSGRLPFTGREREMDALRHAIAAAMDGWVQVAVIVGEAGIGKTRLADEFAGYAKDVGARTYWGRCRDAPAARPYEPWLEIVRQWEREDAAQGPKAAAGEAGGPRTRAAAATEPPVPGDRYSPPDRWKGRSRPLRAISPAGTCSTDSRHRCGNTPRLGLFA